MFYNKSLHADEAKGFKSQKFDENIQDLVNSWTNDPVLLRKDDKNKAAKALDHRVWSGNETPD